MDQISQQRLAQCHPKLVAAIQQLDQQLLDDNIHIRVVQALRTFAQQDALYAQGRTAPGKVVTNAKGGWSNHNFGMAVDCVPGVLASTTVWTPDWNGKDPSYQDMVKRAELLGLVAGAEWHFTDYPHLQLGEMPVTPTNQMRLDLSSGGISYVWERADKGVYQPGYVPATQEAT